ncbi:hypothetical protein G3I59_38375 [Amycolatopsis rubida]|uniref:Uncharacterized protein n=1 Tax=Amycolatopsis rubida TaxID=112413 RepID=A0ABX0C1V1_9PSEU|nr:MULTISPECIES: hypothetical protein [Amycolatopsis]MYW96324.1 hypothetical protein [Amycolatopsis rubida]NEC61314.1 hypothetical protein [Amycolatopsis rubida]OAP24149.1 hypothetical protein A4R44_04922 [Amycolatopsis sp. M39]
MLHQIHGQFTDFRPRRIREALAGNGASKPVATARVFVFADRVAGGDPVLDRSSSFWHGGLLSR